MLIVLSAVISFVCGAGLAAYLSWNRGKLFKSMDVERASLDRTRAELERARSQIQQDAEAWQARKISTENLVGQAAMLKRDLYNLDTTVRKLDVDRHMLATRQVELEARSVSLADRYLAEVEKWVGASITSNNYAACKQRLERAIEAVRAIGYEVSEDRERRLISDLKGDFESAVRAALDREEQSRIKARIREEQAREREVQRELDRLERERHAIQIALQQALAAATSEHSEEVERLKARLAEAEERNRRAVSQAQLTRAGHIYVISNLGSFGENVYKIGMTRRLEPLDRVCELGDASVPFPFDVHMMISSKDAPALETALHRQFGKHRLNRVNPRKEFFRLDLQEVHKFVVERHGEVSYVAAAPAAEYQQSVTMSAEDQKYIENVFEEAEAKLGVEGTDE